jgi:transposase
LFPQWRDRGYDPSMCSIPPGGARSPSKVLMHDISVRKLIPALHTHRREVLAWFAARGLFAHGGTEGFNNKAQITTRKAYGFRSYEHAEIALYHALGELPEPDWLAYGFC